MLKMYVNNNMDDWDKHLITIEIAINDAIQDSTGYSPYYLNSGQTPHFPLTLAADESGSERRSIGSRMENVSEWAERLVNELRDARINLESAQENQRQQADKHRRVMRYKVGDKALLATDDMPSHQGKLRSNFIGPFQVKKVWSDVLVELDLPPALEFHPKVHVEKLKPFTENPSRFPTRRQINRQVALQGKRRKKEWGVERILAEREVEGEGTQYLLLWEGYTTADASWQWERNLGNASQLVSEWKELKERNRDLSLDLGRQEQQGIPSTRSINISSRSYERENKREEEEEEEEKKSGEKADKKEKRGTQQIQQRENVNDQEKQQQKQSTEREERVQRRERRMQERNKQSHNNQQSLHPS